MILLYILKTVWCMNFILQDYESVWPEIWPKINVGHCDLYFMVQWFCNISWRLFDVWTLYFVIMSQCNAAFALKQCRSQWTIFHVPVILPYILNSIWSYMWTPPDGHEGELVFVSGRLRSPSGRLFDGVFNGSFQSLFSKIRKEF